MRKVTTNDRHIGSDFDDFLREEGVLQETEAVAANRVSAGPGDGPGGDPRLAVQRKEWLLEQLRREIQIGLPR